MSFSFYIFLVVIRKYEIKKIIGDPHYRIVVTVVTNRLTATTRVPPSNSSALIVVNACSNCTNATVKMTVATTATNTTAKRLTIATLKQVGSDARTVSA